MSDLKKISKFLSPEVTSLRFQRCRQNRIMECIDKIPHLNMASRRAAAALIPVGSAAKKSFLLYLATMYRSFSSCELLGPGFLGTAAEDLLEAARLASQTALARRLPREVMTARWPGGHSSRSRERTREMWEPSWRCTPEHSMQMSAPRLMLAQSGAGASQSTHLPLPATSLLIVLIASAFITALAEPPCPLLLLISFPWWRDETCENECLRGVDLFKN